MADTKKFDVFISYSHGDESWASEFVHALEAQGVRAWFDKADIALGERWSEQIGRALRESKVVVVLLSPDYVNNPSTFFELGAALGGNKRIIPVLTQEVEYARIPLLLRDRHFLQESSPQVAGKRVAEVVGHLPQDNTASAG